VGGCGGGLGGGVWGVGGGVRFFFFFFFRKLRKLEITLCEQKLISRQTKFDAICYTPRHGCAKIL